MTRIIKIGEESAKLPVRIRLKGKWPERDGFRPGTNAQVQVEFGRLIISAPTDAPETPVSACAISPLVQ